MLLMLTDGKFISPSYDSILLQDNGCSTSTQLYIQSGRAVESFEDIGYIMNGCAPRNSIVHLRKEHS